MQGIRKDIYESLFTTAVTVVAPQAADSLGDAEPQAPVTYYGYLYEHNEKVLNDQGQEVLSGAQIYLRGNDAKSISILSKVSYDQVKDSPIIARKIYRGKQGALVIGVIYLP